jgi:hypothetical protein
MRSILDYPELYDVDPEDRDREWSDDRMDELYSHPKALADAIDACLSGGESEALVKLLEALSGITDGADAHDNMVLQHSAAKRVVDNLVRRVIEVEGRART